MSSNCVDQNGCDISSTTKKPILSLPFSFLINHRLLSIAFLSVKILPRVLKGAVFGRHVPQHVSTVTLGLAPAVKHSWPASKAPGKRDLQEVWLSLVGVHVLDTALIASSPNRYRRGRCDMKRSWQELCGPGNSFCMRKDYRDEDWDDCRELQLNSCSWFISLPHHISLTLMAFKLEWCSCRVHFMRT